MQKAVVILLIGLFAACETAAPGEREAAAGPEEVCEVVQSAESLPPGLDESSGVVVGRRDPTMLWTHNDSGWPAEIFSITPAGELIARIPVAGADNIDWEDLAWGPCPEGECLYIGDIGDNSAVRNSITVYRLPEPDPRAAEARVSARFDMRYPDGPRDAEGLFVTPEGVLYIVSKGNGSARPALYRYPGELRAGETVELQLVTPLSDGPPELLDRLTAADISPSGEWVGIRSYRELTFHRAHALLSGDTVPVHRFDLEEVEEVQGEGFTLLDNGTVYLTGEAGFDDARGTVSILRCRL
jgi:hypothetical protein